MTHNLHNDLLPMKGSIRKSMIVMLISMAVFLGIVAGFQALKAKLTKRYIIAHTPTAIDVSVMKAQLEPWQPHIIASGTARAIQGVEVTTEISGMVQEIYFQPGSYVDKGTILLKLDDSTEVAQLNALKAQAALSKITYDRDNEQYKIQAVSQQVLDTDYYNLKNIQAQVDQQATVVAKKSIKAPFSGRLGIREANLGQFINPGDKIVSLQALDPIYIDFYLPQQAMKNIAVGQTVNIVCDAYPKQKFSGTITTINPNADPSSRNIEVEATLANKQQRLLPGMYATVEVDTGKKKNYITLPQAAITYNAYGSIVYIVKESHKDKNNKPILTVNQTFVTLGDTRGDQVAIVKGVEPGDLVVTSGQVKIKNGSVVAINNKTIPEDNPNPHPSDE